MLILCIMAAGVFLGYKFELKKTMKVNEKFQMAATGVLIFIMGISLGQREGFLNELLELGWKSIVFTVAAVAFSVLFVYLLSNAFLKGTGGKKS